MGIESPAFLEFPVVGGGSTWTLTEDQVNDWAALYPNLDVRQQARMALAWVKADPTRRKTARGMPRFLVGWLTRAVDRGSGARMGMPHLPPDDAQRRPAIWATCPHRPKCGTAAECNQRQRGRSQGA